MGEAAVVHVKRDVNGLTVTIEAPRLAKFVQEYCKNATGMPEASQTDPALGKIWPGCTASGSGKGAVALGYITRYRSGDGAVFNDGASESTFGTNKANLFMLRAEAALKGPVTYTFKGLFSKEIADQYFESAKTIIGISYRELTSEFDKKVVIKVEDVGRQEPVPAVPV